MWLCATYKRKQCYYVQRIKESNVCMCNVHSKTMWLCPKYIARQCDYEQRTQLYHPFRNQKSYAADFVTHKRNDKERCLLTDWEDIRNDISRGNCHRQKKDVQDRRTWFTDLEVDGEIWNLTYMEQRKWEPLRQNVTRNMLQSEAQNDTRLRAGLFQYFIRSVQHLRGWGATAFNCR